MIEIDGSNDELMVDEIDEIIDEPAVDDETIDESEPDSYHSTELWAHNKLLTYWL